MATLVDLLRLFVGVAILSFASYTDWKWRRAPNVLWLVMASAGVLLLAVEAVLDWPGLVAKWPYLVFAPVFAGLMYVFWYFGLIAGGADAKALMASALLVPFPLALADGWPLWQAPTPGAFTLLGNSLMFFLLIPATLLLWNLAHGNVRLPHAILGVKIGGRDVRRGHAWPMEIVNEDGSRSTRLFASRMSSSEVDDQFDRLQALGDEKVWVTPKIPFMLPLLAGYVAAFTMGDILFAAIQAIVGG